MNRPWYQELYDLDLPAGPQEAGRDTLREVDFIEKEICYDRARTILDIGCGSGRHSLELARRGYTVTGIDLSERQLDLARRSAGQANLTVEFFNRDARALNYYNQFHVALLLCEGAFSLMETDEMDWMILRNAARALLPGGCFILTCPNAPYRITHHPAGSSFDMQTFRETFSLETGRPAELLECNRRYYTCPEIRWLLRQSGFQKIHFFAVTTQGFDRSASPNCDHAQLGVIAEK